jgi:hypothetical protein
VEDPAAPESGKRRRKCYESKHVDRLVRGGKRAECTICGDSFPCKFDCTHYNCMVLQGRELPEECTQTKESIQEDNDAYFAGLR